MASYYVWSGATGSANGTSWANAYTTLTAAFSGKVAGDIFYLAHDHAESTSGAVNLLAAGTIANPTKIICVNRAGSVPPVSADRRATASIAAVPNNNLTLTGCAHYDGVILAAGTGTFSSANVICHNANNNWLRFDNCSLQVPIGSGSASNIYMHGAGGTLGGCYTELNNTTCFFNSTANHIYVAGVLRWRNTPSAILGSILPSLLFQNVSGGPRGAIIECIGVDFSALGSGKTLFAFATDNQAPVCRLVDCKFDAAATKVNTISGYGSGDYNFVRSGATGVNYTVYRTAISGTLTEELTVVRSGGASDGVTPISWKVITTATCTYSMPFECPPIAIWNDTTGSAKTATIEGVWGGGAVPNDDDIWVDLEYLGSSSSPQGSFVNDGKADLLIAAAAQTSSSATWGGSTTKFKLNVTFTAQQKGWVYARVKCAKASSTFYVDPLITLT